jgi:hypothetical protein
MYSLSHPPTKSEIFTVYNKMRAALRTLGNQKALERCNRAMGMLQSKAYWTDTRHEYTPSPHDCGCKDWEFYFSKKRGWNGPCKHMMAEIMVEKIIELRIERAAYDYVDADGLSVFESAYRS